MKFLADMGIARTTVRRLRERGHDSVHLLDLGLHRLPDPEILDMAAREGRVVLTVDLDFAQVLAVRRASTPSVVLFRMADKRPPSIEERLDAVLEQCARDLERGVVVSVDDRSIRVHSLPLAEEES